MSGDRRMVRDCEFCCPFYSWNSHEAVHCEGAKLTMDGREGAREYLREYCCDVNGWRRCTVARFMLRRYEAAAEAAEFLPVAA